MILINQSQGGVCGCPILVKKRTIVMILLYTGMDADELSSCGNLSDSNVSNESGRGNESMIDPSLPGTSAVL